MTKLTATQESALRVLREFYPVTTPWEFGPCYDPQTERAVSLATVRALEKAGKLNFVSEGVVSYKVKGAYGQSISWKREKKVYVYQWPTAQ
jgi:hypothetical protein